MATDCQDRRCRSSSTQQCPMMFWTLLVAALASTSCVDGLFERAPARRALVQDDENRLPIGVCYWRQGSLINGNPTGPAKPKCFFEVRDSEFLDVLGSKPHLNHLVNTSAHEGGVYFPDKDEFYFASARMTASNGQQMAELKKVSLKTGNVSTLDIKTAVTNGMVLDHEGNLLVCQQGSKTEGGYIQRIHLKSLKTTIVADNWFGVPFNSPNDVVVKKDGSIWFTDPSYGRVPTMFASLVRGEETSNSRRKSIYYNLNGFRAAPKVNNQLYKINGAGVVDAVADGFVQPNGLAFSEDEKRLYVTDTGFAIGSPGKYDVTRPHSIYVFDIESDGLLGNRRLFASVGVYDGSAPGLGIPDGIKVDTKGRVYVGTVDGIQAFSRSGKPLGLIRIAGVSNMGFGGKHLDTLYILSDTAISYINLQVKGAGLKYTSEFKYS